MMAANMTTQPKSSRPAEAACFKQHPARQHGNHRFQTQNRRASRGVHLLLADDLQGIPDSAGKNARVENGQPGRTDRPQLRLLKEKHGNGGQHAADQKLDAGKLYPVHLLVERSSIDQKVDGVKLSCIQFLVCGVLSAIPMFLFEKPELGAICSAWLPILYAGIFSSGVGYTLQVIGQKNMDPTVASLILSLESVISVLAGWVLLKQQLSGRELLGCVVMFAAIILAQLPDKK